MQAQPYNVFGHDTSSLLTTENKREDIAGQGIDKKLQPALPPKIAKDILSGQPNGQPHRTHEKE